VISVSGNVFSRFRPLDDVVLGLGPTTVAMSKLSIDGQDYVVAVWKDGDGAGGLPELVKLAEEVGGELLEGSVPVHDGRPPS
jgi:hypothetical protein